MKDEFSQGATTMEVNGLKCTLNMPAALKSQRGSDGQEITHGLPPYGERAAFRVVEYDHACPESWVRGDAMEASYFVPVKAEHGLWLDFNANRTHSHHVAVLISVQGVNPITGRPVGDDRLEQYRVNCPVHGCRLGEGRLCKSCGFQWDAQNYLAGNATPSGSFWLDGFRAKDGVVRQYVFTEDEARGVAAQIVGAERVFAIGIAFYLSKEPKPPVSETVWRGSDHLLVSGIDHSYGHDKTYMLRGVSSSRNRGGVIGAAAGHDENLAFRAARNTPALEIAAGAKIHQRIYPDPEKLDFWQEEPAGRIYINYCSVELAKAIIASGKTDLTAGGEGFMNRLLVGQE